MDDSSVTVPETHERIKPYGVNSRRFSTGKIFLSTTEDQIPHYLRASAGSCHDFCKYGKKNELEVKRRCPVKSIPRRLSTTPTQSQSSVETVVFPKRKSMSVIELKQSPDLKTVLPDTCIITKKKLSTTDSQSSVGSELLAETKKTSLAKLKPAPRLKPHVYAAPKTIKQEASSSPDKLEVCSKKGPTKLKEKNLPAKHVTPLKSKSLAVKEMPSPDTLRGSTSPRSTDLKIGRRTGTSLKPKTSSLEQMSSPKSLGGLKGQRTMDVKIGKSAGKSIAAVKKVLVPPAALLSPRRSLTRVASLKAQNRPVKVSSPLKNQNMIRKAKPKEVNNDIQNKIRKAKPKEVNVDTQNKIRKAKPKELNGVNDDEVHVKTLYVIKVETENNKPLESDQNKNCEAEPSQPSSSSSPESLSFSSHEGVDQESGYTMSDTEDDSFAEGDEDDYIENAETLDDGGKTRKSGMVCSKDKDGKPLKFRRGTVVDMELGDNSPRRLKFRRGRVLGDNQNVKSDAHRRSFKKRGVRAIGTLPAAEKVVLRHQDVQGKKDGKGLFNNVIEETASKLVETRKSKVKALVGAFETVISLQERKLSANYAA